MNKLVIAVLMSVVSLGGCNLINKNSADGSKINDKQTGELMEMANTLAAGGTIECKVSKEDGTEEITYVASNDKVHMIGVFGGDNNFSEMISDGEFIFTWDPATKKGLKFAKPDPELVKQAVENVPEIPDFSSDEGREIYEQEGYDVKCNPGNVKDGEFVPPADVEFSDMSEMMKGAANMMEKIQNNPGEMPSEAEQAEMKKQAEEIMKSFGQ